MFPGLSRISDDIRANLPKRVGKILVLENIEKRVVAFSLGNRREKLDLHGINGVFFFMNEENFHFHIGDGSGGDAFERKLNAPKVSPPEPSPSSYVSALTDLNFRFKSLARQDFTPSSDIASASFGSPPRNGEARRIGFTCRRI